MKTTMNGVNGLPLTSRSINAAMQWMYDMGERILYPFILVGETARQVRENPDPFFDLEVEKLEFALPKRQLTLETLSTLTTNGFRENEKGLIGSWEGVPIQIYVLQRRYKFFENPDIRFYKVDEYKMPNPWNTYWKSRFIVR